MKHSCSYENFALELLLKDAQTFHDRFANRSKVDPKAITAGERP